MGGLPTPSPWRRLVRLVGIVMGMAALVGATGLALFVLFQGVCGALVERFDG
jgi:hypothetical protein